MSNLIEKQIQKMRDIVDLIENECDEVSPENEHNFLYLLVQAHQSLERSAEWVKDLNNPKAYSSPVPYKPKVAFTPDPSPRPKKVHRVPATSANNS